MCVYIYIHVRACADGEEEELLEARAVLHDVAVREHQKGEDQELLFFYAGDVSTVIINS